MSLRGKKRAHESSTITHALATLALFGLQVAGIDLDEGMVTETVIALAVVYTTIKTIIGRIRATKKIVK